MKTESKKLDNGDLEIKILLDEHDQICLNHDLIDIIEWYTKGPSSEKIYLCRKRMINEYKSELMKMPEMQNKTVSELNSLLSDERALCFEISKLKTYKNRAQREKLPN